MKMKTCRPMIIAYDISKDQVRARIFRILKEWRLDGQKSVHECYLRSNQAAELFLQLSEALDEKSDRLLMAWLESHRPVLVRGRGRVRLDDNLLLIG